MEPDVNNMPQRIWNAVQVERAYQVKKHGGDINWTPNQMLLILLAEVGEVAKAVKDVEFGMYYDDVARAAEGYEAMVDELIDVMAVCQAMLEKWSRVE